MYLTCADYLRRLGHSPVIFESMPKLGGMLRYGIPEYRLPKKVLDWEIQGILDLGIEARTNVRFGRDFDLEYLLVEGYKAVFIAAGAWNSSKMRVEGEDDLESVLPSIEGVGHSERAGMPEIPVAEREHNEIEVELGLSEEETRTEANRCLRCGLTCYNREVAGRVGWEAA